MAIRRFSYKVGILQAWCRDRIANLTQVREEVKHRFRHLEREVIAEEKAENTHKTKRHAVFDRGTHGRKERSSSAEDMVLAETKQEDESKGDAPSSTGSHRIKFVRQSTVTAHGRITKRGNSDEMVDDRVVNKFLRLELRSARHRSLMRKETWTVHLNAYYEEVAAWRTKRQACILMGFTKEEIRQDCPLPVRPPYENHSPQEAELLEWVIRCRTDPTKITARPIAGKRIPVTMATKDPDAEKFDSELNVNQKVSKGKAEKARPPSARDFLPRVIVLDEEKQFNTV
jgi:hypothetical protein